MSFLPGQAAADALAPPITEPQDTAGNRRIERYDPIGYDLSGFDVFPSVTLGARADDNVFFDRANRQSDLVLQISPGLRIVRNDKVQALSLDASLRRSIYARLGAQNTTEYGLRTTWRRGTERASATVDAGYRREVVQRGTAENDLTGGPPLIRRVLSASITGRKAINRLAIDGRAAITRLRFEPVDAAANSVADQRFRNGERYEGQLAVSYEMTGRTAVFASGSYQRFDYRRSAAIGNRDADDWSGLVGIRYDLNRLLIAQVAAGYRTHRFVDPAQRTISGPAISAQLRYYPNRLLTLRGDVEQTVTTSPYDLVGAVTVTTARLAAEYEYRRNLSLQANVTTTFEDYGHAHYSARSLAFAAGPVWRVNRWLRANATLAYSQRFVNGAAPFEPYRQFAGLFSITVAP